MAEEKLTNLLCPEFGRDEAVTITEILKKRGDPVKLGEPVFAVEAQKGASKIYCLCDGFVKEIRISVGDKVKMGELVAVITDTPMAAREEITKLLCPEFGRDEAVTITEILKKAGDPVKLGDAVFAVEAQKGASKIYCLKDGFIKETAVAVGDKVKMGELVALITDRQPERAPVEENLTDLLCPEFGRDEAVTITEILRKAGDPVKLGDPVFAVEAQKGASKIYCLKDGFIKEILVAVGDKVKMGEKVAVITDAGSRAAPRKEEKPRAPKTNAKKTDLLIIGGGPGGYVAAIYAAQNGRKVTLIEKNRLGGTCLNVGCIPTKSFVKSSEVYEEALRANEFGIKIEKATPDMKGILRHKDAVVDRLVSGVEFLMKKNQIEVISGTASFIDERTVSVEGAGAFTADDIIIATGSKVASANIPGLGLPVVMDSTAALSREDLPESVTIIGGGVIGMEFAFIWNNLGVKVRVVEFMDRVLTMLDPDVSARIEKIAADRGITVRTSSRVTEVGMAENGWALVKFEKDGAEHVMVSEKVLFAIGRTPNMDGLNVEAAGVELNDRGRGIKVDGRMKTSKEHIYAIGDVTNVIQLAHVASEQGIVAVDNIMGAGRQMDYTAVPNVIFTDPEIASVGLTEADAEKKGLKYSVSSFSFAGNGKAVSMGRTDGFVKLIRDDVTEKLVGGAIIGPDASALIDTITLAVQNGMDTKRIEHTIFPHPTTGEAVHEAVLGFGKGSIHR